MGNCCGLPCCPSEEDKGYQEIGPDEHTRLLNDPVSNTASRPVTSQNYNTHNTPPQQKGDEQSALNRILHQTANNVIDVSAIDAHTMEQHEYMDRVRQYSVRVAVACGNSHRHWHRPHLPSHAHAPHTVLAAPPLSLADIQLITNASVKAADLVKDVRVKHKEDLVVPFGVP